MTRLLFPCLLACSLLISGCINRTPPTPPLTQSQLDTALSNSETRMTESIANLCQDWQGQQQQHGQQLQQIENNQQQIDSNLESIKAQLQQHIDKPAPVVVAKPAECPKPSASTGGHNLGNKIVVGRVEWLWIEAINRVYEARVDTGATTSSISALDITPFEKDGKRWVRFKLAPDDGDESFEVEAPLVRYVRIRQASSDTLDRRPVAALTVRLGKMTEVAEFTLTDRTQMTYPILLGREFLRDVAVVDVAKDNVQPKPEIMAGQNQPAAVSKTKKK
jgi:hypothetical protein